MDIWFSLLILAAAWFLIYIICRMLKLDERFGWSFGPLFLLMRTKWFNRFIEKLAKKYARFWRFIGNISIVIGFLCMFASLGLFVFTVVDFFMPDPTIPSGGVGLIIPGVTISFRTFLFLIIPIILTMIPHELAHGVVAHADGVELKSTGLVFFAIFFGAFVEPDEDDILDSKPETKMRTFAAGIFPNLLLALITIPFLVFQTQILSPLYYPPDGVLIFETVPNSPADQSGLARGIAILDINGTHIDSPATFSQVMNATQPNQTLLLNTTKGEYSVILTTNPSNNATGFLGVQTIPYFPPKYSWAAVFFPYFYSQEVMWTLVVSFGAVALNSLPIPIIVDGDKLLSTFLTRYIKNERLALIILDIFRFLALSLFLASLVLPLVRNGFTRII